MKVVATFLIVLNFFSACHGWTCRAAPQMFPAAQIDAGQGEVVMTGGGNSSAFFLSGPTWSELGSANLKHVTVGPAGIWGVDVSDKVFKFVAGDFQLVNGLVSKQVDAGGQGQVVGVSADDTIHCLKSDVASSHQGIDYVDWTNLQGSLMYLSCSPFGCWGVSVNFQIFFTRITPTTCYTEAWKFIDGVATMVEVGADGNVFIVNIGGDVFQRSGITAKVPDGTGWVKIPIRMTVKHVSYDLGLLWLVTEDGHIMRCDQ